MKTKNKTQNELLKKAQNELLDKFVSYKSQKAPNSFEEYRQVINALNILCSVKYCKNSIRNFWDLLPKVIGKKDKDNKERFKNLLSELREANSNYNWGSSKKSYKTYINQFILFCKNEKSELGKVDSLAKLNINAADEAAFINEGGQIYLRGALFTKFKSRLRCQDRTSGDKIWLPLRFIAKLFSLEKKDKKQKENRFSSWLDNLTSNIYVHYIDSNTIKSIKINDDNFLALKFEHNNDETFKVNVRLSYEGNDNGYLDYPVYTPTGKGNLKEQMVVKDISEIDIDHVKSIDQTLREKESNLNVLKEVSDFYKELQAQDNPDENKGAKELFEELNNKGKLDGLLNDLRMISNDGVLRLMDSKYNSQKSNGETFQGIYKRDNESYYGVIETGIKKKDEDGTFTLYQELTDDLNKTGSLTIDNEDNLGRTIDDKISDLEKIINLI